MVAVLLIIHARPWTLRVLNLFGQSSCLHSCRWWSRRSRLHFGYVNLAAGALVVSCFRYSQRQLLQLLCWACALAIVGSLIVVALRPDVGLIQHDK